MIKRIFVNVSFLFVLTLMLSCKALPVNYTAGQSWLVTEKKAKKALTTLSLSGVHVDRAGSRDSIEKEVACLTPLYFWDYKCMVVAGERADYTAEVHVREREFNVGLKTKRSLAVEVRIWAYESAPEEGTHIWKQHLPAAVGRVIAIGEKSFTSSKTINRFLSKAIKKAVRELARYERKKNGA